MRSFLALLVLTAALGASAPVAGAADVRADFNGDGYEDLVVGVPYEDIGGVEDAGGFNVLYGSPAGPGAERSAFFSMTSLPGELQRRSHFGDALAGGDFNGDGYTDLAAAAPSYDSESLDSGCVVLVYGSSRGLSAAVTGIVRFGRGQAGYGSALAAGDFDGDGVADLAVGAPDWSPRPPSPLDWSRLFSGGVEVWYGSPSGLERRSWWTQDSFRVRERSERDDRFGSALAAGDFDGDGADDLAVGVPWEDSDGGLASIGAVNVLYGGGSGLTRRRNQVWSQFNAGAGEEPGEGDRFGSALAAGDFDGDGRDDLAVGVPGEDWRDWPSDTGAVNVLYGTADGLSGGEAQVGSGSDKSRFGSALAAADLDGDGAADLVVGAPGRWSSLDGEWSSGSFGLYYARDGLIDFVHPVEHPIAQDGAEVGAALAVGDYNGDGRPDLAVGAPGFDIEKRDLLSVPEAGAVGVYFGDAEGGPNYSSYYEPAPRTVVQASGLVEGGAMIEVRGVAELGDRFGSTLAG